MNSTTRLMAILLTGMLIAACGGGDDGAPASTGSGGSGNQAPTISGSAPSQVAANSQYSFTPTAADQDNDTLTFSVTNLPSWASFNASSGRLSGAPSAADAGQYNNIRITVSDGSATASLSAFSITVVSSGSGSATLSWLPPTENTDGTPLTNLDGYKVYWGPAADTYTNSVTLDNEGLTSYVVEGLTPGLWYFTTTSFNTLGIESSFSNVASKSIL